MSEGYERMMGAKVRRDREVWFVSLHTAHFTSLLVSVVLVVCGFVRSLTHFIPSPTATFNRYKWRRE